MLASRFSRMRETPVRYAALDPAHAQAIRNYIHLHLRGGQHSRALWNLTNPQYTANDDPAHFADVHRKSGGLLDSLLPQIMQGNDPQALQIYLDATQDYGGPGAQQPFTGTHARGYDERQPYQHLIDLLHGIHRGAAAMTPLSSAYQTTGVPYGSAPDHPQTRLLEQLGHVRRSIRGMGLTNQRQLSTGLNQSRATVMSGQSHGAASAYDLGDLLDNHPELSDADQTMGGDLRHYAQSYLSQHALPHLDTLAGLR